MTAKKFIYAVTGNNPPPLSGADGINAAALETVCYKDLAAIISSIDADRFDLHAASEYLQADLLKYQQVNALLLERSGNGGILPLKFGFTAGNGKEVEAVLKRAYLQLRAHLDRFKGKVELIVQANWNLSEIIQQIAQDHPEFISADSIETGKRLFEATEMKKRGFIDAVHGRLSPLASDFSDGPRKAEDMILNRSYLLEQSLEMQFDAAMNDLGERYDAILSFRYIGPLPAYSFVNIELNQGNFTLLDKAIKTLKLPETANWGEIKSAYRQLLLAHHPDANPDDPGAAERCREVVTAFELVSAYCQSCHDFTAKGNEGEYTFSKDKVEKTFILDTKSALLAHGSHPDYQHI
ncbi:MAG: GvpL/GvpF family gas vesicle protein [Gallionella sp.]|jgi:DnaJ-domain-containing protein 1